MDADRFDRLTRALTSVDSRRVALAALVGGTLGLRGLASTTAKNGKGHGKKKMKKKKRRNLSLPPPPPPPPTPPMPPPGPPALPCTDGIKNGSETDIDCGGTCPRCAFGKSCATRNDCASALCLGGMCRVCSSPNNCGGDAAEPCSCRTSDNGSNVCTTGNFTSITQSCSLCPTGEACVPAGGGEYYCFKRCQDV